MARSVSTIQELIINTLVASAAAVGVVIDPATWSAYDYRQLLTFVTASASASLEQIYDAFVADVEVIVSAASPQTGEWFQAQMLKFQYSLTDPQIIQLDDVGTPATSTTPAIDPTFAPYYPVVNTDLQIIKYCAVVPGAFGSSFIKVAKQTAGLPTVLSVAEVAAAQSYARQLSVPGISMTVLSSASDKIYIAATIYYEGLYSGVIQDTVIAAIQSYLQIQSVDNPNGIPFNGFFTLSDLEVAIKSVSGVSDVVFTNVRGRADGTPYPGGYVMVIGTDGAIPTGNVISRNYSLAAGYCETETSATHEITDSLTFIPV